MRFDQARGLRKSMSWLHTWAGLVLGWLLFAIFLTGTLSYFRNEITLWMQPELHSARPDEKGLDRALSLLGRVAPGAAQWQIALPGERSPVFGLNWREAGETEGRGRPSMLEEEADGLSSGGSGAQPPGSRGRSAGRENRGADEGAQRRRQGPPEASSGPEAPEGRFRGRSGGRGTERSGEERGRERGGRGGGGGGEHGGPRLSMNPATGGMIAPRETAGGDFLYRFHFELYGMDRALARWIVGIATLFMFVAMVSGIIIHRNIFKDFFTFRPGKGKRSWLDAHNATSVLALPFHLMITFSGLLLLANQIMPWAAHYAYGGSVRAMMGEMKNMHAESASPRSGESAPLAALSPLLEAARRQWPQEGVGAITISNPGDANARVEFRQARGVSLATRAYPQSMVFDGRSGQLLEAPHAAEAPGSVRAIWSGLNALHLGRFASPLLRWMFFASGVLGCVMVASGLVMWVIARQRDRERAGRTPFGHRLVEVFNVAGVAGLLLATVCYFWASRLIPADIIGRSRLEIACFFIVWLLALPHAALRTHREAWVEQLGLAGLLTLLLPLLNALGGGAWLPLSLVSGQWQVAGFDVAALGIGALLILAAWRTHTHVPRSSTTTQAGTAGMQLQTEEA